MNLFAQTERRIPAVLGKDEVFKILAQVTTLLNYVYLFTVYACGLKLHEVMHLEVLDIDSFQMMIHVHRGKSAKDRYVSLQESTLLRLRKYWVTHRNPHLIFPAQGHQ